MDPNNDKTALRHGLLQILDEAMQVDGAAAGKIRVARAGSSTLEIAVQRGFSEDFVQAFRAISPEDECPSARAARTRKRVIVPDLERQPPADPLVAAVRDAGVRAMQATPLVAPDGAVIGTLSTCFRHVHALSAAAALVLDHHARRAASLIKEFPD
jgi:GAF domain-containing protein